MLDVHPPHESAHSFRDIAIHLGIITVGLFIALSLEGLVEWRHHRHLVHQAEEALRGEIASNAKGLPDAIEDVKKQNAELDNDLKELGIIARDGKASKDGHMEISFHLRSFDSVAWKTAQSTGALSYMSYEEAQKFSNIYSIQEQLHEQESQGARDAIISLAPFAGSLDTSPDLTKAQAAEVAGKIGVLKGQLMLVSSLMIALDKGYKQFDSDRGAR